MDNRSTILTRALELFAARGYDAVGVQEIAAKSGVTKPTLYYYFASKSGLLDALLAEYGGRFDAAIRAASVYREKLDSALNALTIAFFKFAKENGLFYRMQLAMYFAAPESIPNRMVRRMVEGQFQMVEAVFIRAVAESPHLGKDHQTYAATFIGTLNTYIGFALNGYVELNEELAVKAVHQFMHGVG